MMTYTLLKVVGDLLPNQLFQDSFSKTCLDLGCVSRHPFELARLRVYPFVVPPSVSVQVASSFLQDL